LQAGRSAREAKRLPVRMSDRRGIVFRTDERCRGMVASDLR
jgi:hypothetical protein